MSSDSKSCSMESNLTKESAPYPMAHFATDLRICLNPQVRDLYKKNFPFAKQKTKLLKIIDKNNKAYKDSNDKGSNQVGVKMMEGQALFQLSFFSYDKLTDVNNEYTFTTPNESQNNVNTGDREERFSNDQIIDRMMVKEMGRGVRDIQISFENPIIIS